MKNFQVVLGCVALCVSLTMEDNETFREFECLYDSDCLYEKTCLYTGYYCECMARTTLATFRRCKRNEDSDGSIWTLMIIVIIFAVLAISLCSVGVVILYYQGRKRRRNTRRGQSDTSSVPGTSRGGQIPPAHMYLFSTAPPPYGQSFHDVDSPPPPPYLPPSFNPPTYHQHGPQPPPPYYNYASPENKPTSVAEVAS